MKNILTAIFLLTAHGSPLCSQEAQLTPEQKAKLMEQHYAKAFELYAARNYPRAIEHWNNVLRLDPEQQTAKKLLVDAREKLRAQNHEREDKLQAFLDDGDYRKAYDVLQQLLDADPTSQRHLALQSRMEKVVPVLPRARGRGRSSAVLKTGVAAYVGASGRSDPRLAYDALRYYRELEPGAAAGAKLVGFVETDYPDMAAADPLPEGVSFLEYKKKACLDFIYEAKYAQAVKACEAVVALEPQDVPSLKRYGTAYYQLGKRKTAWKIWERALKLAPDDKQLKKFLGKTVGDEAP